MFSTRFSRRSGRFLDEIGFFPCSARDDGWRLVVVIETSRHAIATLLGQFPESMSKELARGGGLPAPPATIPIGLPSQLLRRRPDIA